MKPTFASVKVAVCDQEAFYPLRALVLGPFDTLDDLVAIERFIRTVVLHDEMVMQLTPQPYDPDTDFEFTEEERRAGGRLVITATGPALTGFDFFKESAGRKLGPEIEMSPALIKVASQFANAGAGNAYFETHVDYLKHVLGVVMQGGSVLLCSDFGQQAITTVGKYPAALFEGLDEEWRCLAQSVQQNGLGLLVPPFLGVVLNRCARRDTIPIVIRELRDEWAGARRKVWALLDALRASRTLGEFMEMESELSQASRLFSPQETELDSHPIRVFWEIIAGTAAGAVIAQLSGGNVGIGAATGTMGQLASKAPGFLHEFGPALFGRGAFDLAKKVRREVSQVEFDALSRLLTDGEKRKLGLR